MKATKALSESSQPDNLDLTELLVTKKSVIHSSPAYKGNVSTLSTTEGGGGYLPWIWGRVPILDRGYLPWTRGYLPWMEGGGGAPTPDGGTFDGG